MSALFSNDRAGSKSLTIKDVLDKYFNKLYGINKLNHRILTSANVFDGDDKHLICHLVHEIFSDSRILVYNSDSDSLASSKKHKQIETSVCSSIDKIPFDLASDVSLLDDYYVYLTNTFFVELASGFLLEDLINCPIRLKLLKIIVGYGSEGISQSDLAKLLNISPSQVFQQIKILQSYNMVHKETFCKSIDKPESKTSSENIKDSSNTALNAHVWYYKYFDPTIVKQCFEFYRYLPGTKPFNDLVLGLTTLVDSSLNCCIRTSELRRHFLTCYNDSLDALPSSASQKSLNRLFLLLIEALTTSHEYKRVRYIVPGNNKLIDVVCASSFADKITVSYEDNFDGETELDADHTTNNCSQADQETEECTDTHLIAINTLSCPLIVKSCYFLQTVWYLFCAGPEGLSLNTLCNLTGLKLKNRYEVIALLESINAVKKKPIRSGKVFYYKVSLVNCSYYSMLESKTFALLDQTDARPQLNDSIEVTLTMSNPQSLSIPFSENSDSCPLLYNENRKDLFKTKLHTDLFLSRQIALRKILSDVEYITLSDIVRHLSNYEQSKTTIDRKTALRLLNSVLKDPPFTKFNSVTYEKNGVPKFKFYYDTTYGKTEQHYIKLIEEAARKRRSNSVKQSKLSINSISLSIMDDLSLSSQPEMAQLLDINLATKRHSLFKQKYLSYYGFVHPIMTRVSLFHHYLLYGAFEGDRAQGFSINHIINSLTVSNYLAFVGCGFESKYLLKVIDGHLGNQFDPLLTEINPEEFSDADINLNLSKIKLDAKLAITKLLDSLVNLKLLTLELDEGCKEESGQLSEFSTFGKGIYSLTYSLIIDSIRYDFSLEDDFCCYWSNLKNLCCSFSGSNEVDSQNNTLINGFFTKPLAKVFFSKNWSKYYILTPTQRSFILSKLMLPNLTDLEQVRILTESINKTNSVSCGTPNSVTNKENKPNDSNSANLCLLGDFLFVKYPYLTVNTASNTILELSSKLELPVDYICLFVRKFLRLLNDNYNVTVKAVRPTGYVCKICSAYYNQKFTAIQHYSLLHGGNVLNESDCFVVCEFSDDTGQSLTSIVSEHELLSLFYTEPSKERMKSLDFIPDLAYDDSCTSDKTGLWYLADIENFYNYSVPEDLLNIINILPTLDSQSLLYLCLIAEDKVFEYDTKYNINKEDLKILKSFCGITRHEHSSLKQDLNRFTRVEVLQTLLNAAVAFHLLKYYSNLLKTSSATLFNQSSVTTDLCNNSKDFFFAQFSNMTPVSPLSIFLARLNYPKLSYSPTAWSILILYCKDYLGESSFKKVLKCFYNCKRWSQITYNISTRLKLTNNVSLSSCCFLRSTCTDRIDATKIKPLIMDYFSMMLCYKSLFLTSYDICFDNFLPLNVLGRILISMSIDTFLELCNKITRNINQLKQFNVISSKAEISEAGASLNTEVFDWYSTFSISSNELTNHGKAITFVSINDYSDAYRSHLLLNNSSKLHKGYLKKSTTEESVISLLTVASTTDLQVTVSSNTGYLPHTSICSLGEFSVDVFQATIVNAMKKAKTRLVNETGNSHSLSDTEDIANDVLLNDKDFSSSRNDINVTKTDEKHTTSTMNMTELDHSCHTDCYEPSSVTVKVIEDLTQIDGSVNSSLEESSVSTLITPQKDYSISMTSNAADNSDFELNHEYQIDDEENDVEDSNCMMEMSTSDENSCMLPFKTKSINKYIKDHKHKAWQINSVSFLQSSESNLRDFVVLCEKFNFEQFFDDQTGCFNFSSLSVNLDFMSSYDVHAAKQFLDLKLNLENEFTLTDVFNGYEYNVCTIEDELYNLNIHSLVDVIKETGLFETDSILYSTDELLIVAAFQLTVKELHECRLVEYKQLQDTVLLKLSDSLAYNGVAKDEQTSTTETLSDSRFIIFRSIIDALLEFLTHIRAICTIPIQDLSFIALVDVIKDFCIPIQPYKANYTYKSSKADNKINGLDYTSNIFVQLMQHHFATADLNKVFKQEIVQSMSDVMHCGLLSGFEVNRDAMLSLAENYCFSDEVLCEYVPSELYALHRPIGSSLLWYAIRPTIIRNNTKLGETCKRIFKSIIVQDLMRYNLLKNVQFFINKYLQFNSIKPISFLPPHLQFPSMFIRADGRFDSRLMAFICSKLLVVLRRKGLQSLSELRSSQFSDVSERELKIICDSLLRKDVLGLHENIYYYAK